MVTVRFFFFFSSEPSYSFDSMGASANHGPSTLAYK
jgi:hypothetical protein